MKAILGGTFDPVHLGHLHVATAAGAALGADAVTLLLAARPWHRAPPAATADDRFAMLQLAVEDANADANRPASRGRPRPVLSASDHELARPGPSYTARTLAELAGDGPVIWLLGSDAVSSMSNWHAVGDLAKLCHLLVVPRPGATPADNAPPPGFVVVADAREFAARDSGGLCYLKPSMLDISATRVRERIAAGRDVGALLPPRVWAYIRRKALYAKRG